MVMGPEGSTTVVGEPVPLIAGSSGVQVMFWTERGATHVLALRCALKGHRWDECWDRLHDSNYLKIQIAACVSGYFGVTHPLLDLVIGDFN